MTGEQRAGYGDSQGRMQRLAGKYIICESCGADGGKTDEYLEDRKKGIWTCGRCGETFEVTAYYSEAEIRRINRLGR